MPNDLEGLIIERAKWNHFNVTTLAILPESLNSLRVRLAESIGFKSHIKPEFCQDLSQTQRCKDNEREWIRFAQNDNNFTYKALYIGHFSRLYLQFHSRLLPGLENSWANFKTFSRFLKSLYEPWKQNRGSKASAAHLYQNFPRVSIPGPSAHITVIFGYFCVLRPSRIKIPKEAK